MLHVIKTLNNLNGKNKDLHIQRTSQIVETIGHGAEAKVYVTMFLERNAVVKVRPEKGYRHPELDIARTSKIVKSLDWNNVHHNHRSDTSHGCLFESHHGQGDKFERSLLMLYLSAILQNVTYSPFLTSKFL